MISFGPYFPPPTKAELDRILPQPLSKALEPPPLDTREIGGIRVAIDPGMPSNCIAYRHEDGFIHLLKL